MPSVQLSIYLRLRSEGASVEDAAEQSCLGLTEARLTEEAIAAGELSLPEPSREEPVMAKPKSDQVAQVVAPDFEKAKRIFLHDLKPGEERSAKVRGEQSQAWKSVEKDAHCNKVGAKFAFKLMNLSDEARDDVLRSLYGLMKALRIGISQDLVDKMQDSDAPEMPTVDKSGGMGADNLVTLADRRPDPDAAAFDNDKRETQPAA